VRFYLGTHMATWLETAGVPLFVSVGRLRGRARLPRAAAPWALDSGGFTQLSRPPHRWTMAPTEYVEVVARLADEVGLLEWAAPMDRMCEPFILAATGSSVRAHQDATVANYLELRGRGPFVPVLQGWTPDDYLRCVELYADAGVDLASEPLVGVGSVCRRQSTDDGARVLHALADCGLRLHGFGVKQAGLGRYGDRLTSADSMAWSARARNEWHHERRRLCGGEHRGGCGNCRAWALTWRDRLLDRLPLTLGLEAVS
jgi:hypothetical protein